MLTLGEINGAMCDLEEWSLEGNSIAKIFSFESFKGALEFVNKVGEAAEKVGHFPDMTVSEKQVRLVLTSHSVGGLEKKDFELAREIDGINVAKEN